MAQSDQDDSTAGAQIRKYLDSQGKKYTAENVRAVLAMNARNPDQSPVDLGGPDPVEGLRNYAIETPRASRGGARRTGGGGGVTGAPPVDLGGNPGIETPDSGGSPTTSAPPVSQLDLTNMILTGLGLGGAGAGGLYAYSKYAGRPMPEGGPAAREVPNFKLADQYGPNPVVEPPRENLPATTQAEPVGRGEVPPSGRVIDVQPPAIEAAPPAARLPAPPTVEGQVIPEAVMQKALAAPTVQPAGPATRLALPAPPVRPADVAVPTLPQGVTGVDVANTQIRANPQVLAAPAAPPAAEVPPVPEAPPATKFKPTGPAVRMIDPEAKGIAQTILREMSGGGKKVRGKVKVPK